MFKLRIRREMRHRPFVYFSIICSVAVLFGHLYTHIDSSVISETSKILLYVMSGIWGCFLLRYYGIGAIKVIFIKKSYIQLPDIPEFEQFSKIAKDMKVKLNKKKPFVFKKGLNNAGFYYFNEQFIFGDILFYKLDTNERLALFYHEITHIKKHHLFRYLLAFCLSGIFIMFTLQRGLDYISSLVWASLFLTIFPYISRKSEYEADYGAAQGTSLKTAISLLKKLGNSNLWDRETITHPSIKSRIAKLESHQAEAK